MLILGATPIGNTDDSSKRLLNALENSEIIAAEDTRKLLTLAKRLGANIQGKVLSLHDHNEAEKLDFLLKQLDLGDDILVVSDAGLPLINDPGYKITHAAIEKGVRVTCLPGPSAPITALVLSGLPTDKFCFEGFLPPKTISRVNALTLLQDEKRTMIFLESTHRIAKCLEDMRTVFGGVRRAVVCRELTKTYEEVIRGTLDELCEIANERILKGEICVVVGGNR
jgi:16S rRNA (cytidine1402-2'-O)-methyltransferase